jgi:hypothetical protein
MDGPDELWKKPKKGHRNPTPSSSADIEASQDSLHGMDLNALHTPRGIALIVSGSRI